MTYGHCRIWAVLFKDHYSSWTTAVTKERLDRGERRPLILILKSLCRDSNLGWLSEPLLWCAQPTSCTLEVLAVIKESVAAFLKSVGYWACRYNDTKR